jgi:hypothetical protein
MVIFQFALLAFGVVGGLLFAYRLRRQPWSTISRSRAVIAFGGGVAAWISFAAIALPAPFSRVFVGTALALYLPTLILIVSSRAEPASGN